MPGSSRCLLPGQGLPRSLMRRNVDAAHKQPRLVFDPGLRHITIIKNVGDQDRVLVVATDQHVVAAIIPEVDAGKTILREIGNQTPGALRCLPPDHQSLLFSHGRSPYLATVSWSTISCP